MKQKQSNHIEYTTHEGKNGVTYRRNKVNLFYGELTDENGRWSLRYGERTNFLRISVMNDADGKEKANDVAHAVFALFSQSFNSYTAMRDAGITSTQFLNYSNGKTTPSLQNVFVMLEAMGVKHFEVKYI